MTINVCPAANVAAPAEIVWELLSEPKLYDIWWSAHTRRIVPEGPAAPGQVVYGQVVVPGKRWDVTLTVETVDPERHRVQLLVTLPLGLVNHATITCAPIDASTSRLQFG